MREKDEKAHCCYAVKNNGKLCTSMIKDNTKRRVHRNPPANMIFGRLEVNMFLDNF